MKKIISLVVAFIIVCGLSVTGSLSAAAVSDTDFAHAVTLISAVGDTEIDMNRTDSITRGEFVSLALDLFNVEMLQANKQVYTDVDIADSLNNAVFTACKQGWISEADKFYPTAPITNEQALKIIVCALGVGEIAATRGGYPNGFIKTAMNFGIKLPGANTSELSYRDAIVLINDVLLAPYVEFVGVTRDGEVQNVISDKTVLWNIYKIYEVRGIVSRTAYNSLLNGVKIEDDLQVEINGITYTCENLGREFLGKNVRAFCLDGEISEIVCIWEENNKEVIIDIKDYKNITNKRVHYKKDNKVIDELLDEAYITVYNGRRYDALTDSMFNTNDGTVRLLDNDRDNKYEIVFVDCYEYGAIEAVDYRHNSLAIDNKTAISGINEDTVYEIYSEDGTRYNIYDLEVGDYAGVSASKDGALVSVIVYSNIISGTYTMNDSENNIIGIDSKEYEISNHFKNTYLSGLRLGTEISVVVDESFKVITMATETSNTAYGYLIWIDLEGPRNRNLIFNIYTTAGKTKIYNAAEKIRLLDADGYSKPNHKDLYTYLGGDSLTPQLIKYKTDAEGKISLISVAQNNIADNFGTSEADKSILVRNVDQTSIKYRSGAGGFVGKCYATGTPILYVPADATDEEGYLMLTTSDLTSNSSYTVSIYDIDKYGSAGFIVMNASSSGLITSTTASMIVYDVRYTEDGYIIYGYCDGKILSLTYEGDISLLTSVVGGFSKGDVIRVMYNNDGRIVHARTDIKYDALNGAQIQSGLESLYMRGWIYSANNVGMFLLDDLSKDKIYSNLEFRSMPENIVIFRTDLEDIEVIKPDELHTYMGYGSNCYEVILKLSSDASTDMYIYRGE